MKLYLSVISTAMLFIAIENIILNTASWWYVVILIVLCTALQFTLDGLVAIAVQFMPDWLFSVENPLYHVSEVEQNLYKKLKVRKWKDKVWELGGLGGFSKKNLTNPNSSEYIEKFIVECNKGVLTHRLSYSIGFIPMLFIPNVCAFTVALPIAIVNLFLNVLPTFALRYNTPKLRAVLTRMNKKYIKSDGRGVS